MGIQKVIFKSIALGLLVVLCGCNISIGSKGSAEGYGGGDEDFRKVENARLVASSTLRRMKDGDVTDPICDIPICVGANCALLNALSSSQRDFLARLMVDADYSAAIIAFLENDTTFTFSDDPLILGGVELDAVAELRGSHVALNRTRIRARNESELIGLLVHEVMHLAAFPEDSDGILTDEEAIHEGSATVFANGRVLANLAGACVQGHEERERILGSVSRRVQVDFSEPPVLPDGTVLQNLSNAGQQASNQQASGQQTSAQQGSGQQAPSQQASDQQSSGQQASTQQSATQQTPAVTVQQVQTGVVPQAPSLNQKPPQLPANFPPPPNVSNPPPLPQVTPSAPRSFPQLPPPFSLPRK